MHFLDRSNRNNSPFMRREQQESSPPFVCIPPPLWLYTITDWLTSIPTLRCALQLIFGLITHSVTRRCLFAPGRLHMNRLSITSGQSVGEKKGTRKINTNCLLFVSSRSLASFSIFQPLWIAKLAHRDYFAASDRFASVSFHCVTQDPQLTGSSSTAGQLSLSIWRCSVPVLPP